MPRQDRHPLPPRDFPNEPSLIEWERAWFRIHRIDHNPNFYGKTLLNRFDSPDAAYGVLYAAADPYCAFIETFGSSTGINIVSTTALAARAIAELKPSVPLKLIDLACSGSLARIGADARLFAGDHQIAQQWSKALHEHPLHADGILFLSRRDPKKQACAIFDRAPRLVLLEETNLLPEGPKRLLLARILKKYGYQIIETRIAAPKKRPTRDTYFDF